MKDLNDYRLTKLEDKVESITRMEKDLTEIKTILMEKDKNENKFWRIALPIMAAIVGSFAREIISFISLHVHVQ